MGSGPDADVRGFDRTIAVLGAFGWVAASHPDAGQFRQPLGPRAAALAGICQALTWLDGDFDNFTALCEDEAAQSARIARRR